MKPEERKGGAAVAKWVIRRKRGRRPYFEKNESKGRGATREKKYGQQTQNLDPITLKCE